MSLFFAIPFTEELRRLIQKQLKQKELLDNELSREQEKLEMIRFDIITLSTPMISDFDLRQLCDEIFRLRDVCNRLADDLDIATERELFSVQLL